MTMSRKTIAAIGAAALLVVAVPVVASAARDDPARRVVDVRDDFARRLADELDLPVARVEEALEAVHDDVRADLEARMLDHLRQRLDGAVADGDLTREQAEAILDAAAQGVLGPLGGPFWGRGPDGGPIPGLHRGPVFFEP